MDQRKDAKPADAGTNKAGGLGGNRLDQSRTGASVDEETLTEGERRRGGQDVSS